MIFLPPHRRVISALLIFSDYKDKKESGSCISINLSLVLSPIAYSRPHITDLKGWTLRTHACDAKGDGPTGYRAEESLRRSGLLSLRFGYGKPFSQRIWSNPGTSRGLISAVVVFWKIQIGSWDVDC